MCIRDSPMSAARTLQRLQSPTYTTVSRADCTKSPRYGRAIKPRFGVLSLTAERVCVAACATPNGPIAWWQPNRYAARPARAQEPTKRGAWSVRRTAAMLTDRVVLNNALVKWQPNRCAARPAQAHEPTAREVAAGPLRSLPITSTLTHQAPRCTQVSAPLYWDQTDPHGTTLVFKRQRAD